MNLRSGGCWALIVVPNGIGASVSLASSRSSLSVSLVIDSTSLGKKIASIGGGLGVVGGRGSFCFCEGLFCGLLVRW